LARPGLVMEAAPWHLLLLDFFHMPPSAFCPAWLAP